MADTTVWGFTGVADTTTSFPIEGTNVYGVDISGALTPKQVTLAPGIILLLTAGATDADIVTEMKAFIRRYGAGHEGAGGFPVQATIQIPNALLVTSTA